MKVNYYVRNRAVGNYSIENVFRTISKRLSERILVDYFFTRVAVDFRAIFLVRKLDADVHHITGAVNYLAFGLPWRRTIITVHDIGHYTETLRGWRKILYRYLFWVWPLRMAGRITTISYFTKQEIIRHFGISEDKITVIPNPVNSEFRFIRPPFNVVPVILQIGSGRNKNVEMLVAAVRDLRVRLLLVRPPDSSLIQLLQEFEIEYEFRFNLSDADLVQAYADADIVYFASTYEGFGLPILESMAIGRPVITSNISPMKDIAGSAAVLVDPWDTASIRNAVTTLIQSPNLYGDVVERGQEVVKAYQADRVSEQYYELYSELLRKNGPA